MLAGNNFTENFPADVPVGWEFFGTCKTIPQLFLLLSWALWNFELYDISAALWIINNAVILSFQNVIFQKNKLKNRNNVNKSKTVEIAKEQIYQREWLEEYEYG